MSKTPPPPTIAQIHGFGFLCVGVGVGVTLREVVVLEESTDPMEEADVASVERVALVERLEADVDVSAAEDETEYVEVIVDKVVDRVLSVVLCRVDEVLVARVDEVENEVEVVAAIVVLVVKSWPNRTVKEPYTSTAHLSSVFNDAGNIRAVEMGLFELSTGNCQTNDNVSKLSVE